MAHDTREVPAPLQRLVAAVNAHDLEALVDCFSDDYVNRTPAHPRRGFRGRAQVRRNWAAILAGVPDVVASVPRAVTSGATTWTEWEIDGERRDGVPLALRGTIIFEFADDLIIRATLYLEPAELESGDADAALAAVIGESSRIGATP